jgi:hypothetical protein
MLPRGGALSSAFLYLAIVAIWAGVLVPRWLRTPPAPDQAAPAPDQAAQTLEPPSQTWAEAEDGEPGEAVRAGEAARDGVEPARPGERDAGRRLETARAEPGRAPVPAASPGGASRARALRARRRTLTALVVLTAGAAGMALAHLAPVWIAIPPVIMLAGFAALLRGAARTDAQRARQRAATRGRTGVAGHATARGGEGRAQPRQRTSAPVEAAAMNAQGWPGPAAEPETTAQVIDISGRIHDQLYDQYSDAADRAVGD